MCSAFDASEAIDLSSCQAKIVALTHSLVSRVLVLHGAFIDTPPPDNEQDFVVDPSKKIKDLLNGAAIKKFFRWEVGEEA